MSEKELEERAIIDKNQYVAIEQFIKEKYPDYILLHLKNRYFDDAKKTIKSIKNMLRIRSIKGKNYREFTYKVKGDDEDIEYNQLLSYYQFNKIIFSSRYPTGEVLEKLKSDNVDISSLKSLVELRTRRMEVKLKDYTIVLDANEYNGVVDYDIEIESIISKNHAKTLLLQFCEQFNIEYKNDYPTKSNRAFRSINY